jgi:arylsulfatase A-like enzyme
MAKPFAGLMVVIATLLWSSIESHAAERPNVLFIAVDDLKPLLSCYGETLVHSPEIDRLAARGTVFTHAYCQWPVCGPTRASLMTSLRPEANGVMDLKTDVRAKNPSVVTLPQHFKAHGYTTAGVGKIYDPRCVDNKKDCDAPSWSLPFVTPRVAHDAGATEQGDGEPVAAAAKGDDAEQMDGQIARQGVKLLQQLAQSKQPFFVAVGFKKPHLPFIAPQRYWDLYDRSQVPLAAYTGGIQNDAGYATHDSPEFRTYGGIPEAGPIPEAMQREVIHGYLACISFIDAQIGLLLAELERLKLTENTIIVLWGDHGFHLGDHGMWGKHSTLEQAARVPLIIVPPGGSPVHSTPAPVECTDIFPTLCEFSGLSVPPGIAGRSVLPLMTGTATSIRPGALTVFKNRGALAYSFRTERYRYTEWINPRHQVVARDLFDYEADPSETRNLAEEAEHQETRSSLAKQLRDVAVGCDRLLASPRPE